MRYIFYALFIVGAVVVRLWWGTEIEIPHPDVRDADVRLLLALDEAETRVRQAPRAPEVWGNLGALLFAHTFLAEAEQCFQQAAELDVTNWRWPYLKAMSQRSNQPEQAVESLRLALDRDAQAELPRLVRGELLASLGRTEEAEAELRRVLSTSPRQARASLGLARILLERDRHTAALDALAPALHHPSTRRAAYECKAQIEQRQGDQATAADSLAKARNLPEDIPWPDTPESRIDLFRTDRQSYVNRTKAFQKAGLMAEAHQVAREAEQKYPELYFLVEGRIQQEKGNLAAAEKALRKSLDIHPDWVEALHSLGQVLAEEMRPDEAEAMFRQILKVEPSYGPAYLDLALLLKECQPAQARSLLETAVHYMPLSAKTHRELGKLLEAEGDTVEAERHLEHAQHLEP
jgi:tetratricopeptide (TPR) repeat protein